MSNNKLMNYKGFYGSVETSLEDGVLFGKIECINDLVNYEAETLAALRAAFEESVDDYLETCAEIGKSPDKPMSGTFNVRVGAELHKQAYIAATNAGKTLNEFVKAALEEATSDTNDKHVHLHIHATQDAQNQRVIPNQPISFSHQQADQGREKRWSSH